MVSSAPVRRKAPVRAALLLGGAAFVLAACQGSNLPRHMQPLPYSTVAAMDRLGVDEGDPIFMRIFKEEAELEVWKETDNGSYVLLDTYEICAWSGELGPKFREGDRQAPEGFYTIRPAQMNPNSSFYLSFNMGFPNAFDAAHGRTGSHLMVHGACSSRGCYAMTEDQIRIIYSLAREAFEGGQRAFQVHAFPFRMTAENMARHRDHEHLPFWQMLQEGYQHFEATGRPPTVNVCDRRYIFNAQAAGQFSASAECPDYEVPTEIETLVSEAQAKHDAAFQVAVARLEAEELENLQVDPAIADQFDTPVLIAEAEETPPIEPLADDMVATTTVPSPVAAPNGAVASAETAAFTEPRQSFTERAGSMFSGLFSGN